MTIEIPLTQGQVTIVDDEDGDLAQFKWYAAKGQNYAGGGAFHATRTVKTNGKPKQIKMHAVILSRMLGRELVKGEFSDHVYGNPLNNRRYNLRLATSAQNTMNSGIRSNNTSGYKGVSWHKKAQKWMASIDANKRRIYLGLFNTPEEAHQAYCKAAVELHGEFANFG